MPEESSALQERTFTFGDHTLRVECRKTLDQTINFRLTVQCEVNELVESLRGFGGGFLEGDDNGNHVEEPVDNNDPNVPSKPDLLGLDIWPAAFELCTYLAAHPSLVLGSTVAELGAGVGLPGLLAARLGAKRVILTDYEPHVVAHVARNAALCGVEDRCSGVLLDWTKLDLLPVQHRAAYSIVLAADVLYIESIMSGFVDALCSLLDPKNGLCFVGHQTRRALVLDETGTPEVREDDVAFRKFRSLCDESQLHVRVLGTRESPGFPGPLFILALGRNPALLATLPAAFTSP